MGSRPYAEGNLLDLLPSYSNEGSLGGGFYGSRVNKRGAVANLFHSNLAGGLRLELIKGEGEEAKNTAYDNLSHIGYIDVLVGNSSEGAHGV